jgi:fatty-acyl-CoA synthase
VKLAAVNSLPSLLETLGDRCDRGLKFGVWDSSRLSYPDLLHEVKTSAGWLTERCQPGERVLLVAESSRSSVIALLACWWAGLVPICVAPPARMMQGFNYRQHLERWIKAGEARLGLAETDVLERCSEVPLNRGWHPLPLPTSSAISPVLPKDPDQLAYIQFSSGTTVEPKPVGLSHANLLANLDMLLSVFPAPLEQHSCVSWLPLYHDMGLIGGLLAALRARGDLLLLRPFQFVSRPADWLLALTQSRATVTIAPNFALAQCLQRVGDAAMEKIELSAVQLALIGSEMIHPHILREFHQKFAPRGLAWEALTPVYGLAEATLAVTFSPPGRGPRFSNSQGREILSVGPPLPGLTLKLLNAQNEVVPEGEIGEVYLRGPSVMQGYLDVDVRQGEWLATGDLGYLEQGELYLTGRLKDVLILNGRNYAAEIFEQPLSQVEGLDSSRAAAFALPDPERGSERVVVMAERAKRAKGDPVMLTRQAQEVLATATGIACQVQLVEAGWLPRTTSGKVRRQAARQRLLEETGGG